MLRERIKWPNGKKSAGMVSIELDAEYMWLLLDPTNIRRVKTLSMGTYGMLRGLDRILDALEERDMKATFFIPGIIAEKYPDSVKKVFKKGHEIACHGYMLENFGLLSPEEQSTTIAKGINAIEQTIGRKPVGFRLPEGNMTPETLDIIKEAGFAYDASMLDDDVPYQFADSNMVEIPMRWELQDFPYFAFNYFPPFPLGECRIASYTETLDVWLMELEGYERFGGCYVPKFDPQSIGTPARIPMFEKVLDEMLSADMWIATGEEIASFYRNQYIK